MSFALERLTVGALGLQGRREVLPYRVNSAYFQSIARVLRCGAQSQVCAKTKELARSRPPASSHLRSRAQHFFINLEVFLCDDAWLKFLNSLISRRFSCTLGKIDIIQ